MRIAWITYDFEEYSSLHVNAMADDHDVMLMMPQPEAGQPEYSIDPRVEHVAFAKPRLRQPFAQFRSVRQLLQRIDAFRPDVIHFQQGHLWFNGVLSRLRRRYPLVVTIHDPRHHAGDTVSKKTPQWVMDHGFRQAHHAIVHGQALVAPVHSLFGLSAENIHVIPHVAMGTTMNSSFSADQDSENVLFFGRIYDYKGLEYFIKAEPLVSRHFPNVKFVVGGQGDNFRRYQSMMKNPDQFVVHNRWIDDEERATIFQNSAMVVLPYIEATQSGVVPVAYNFARPVVATDVGALSDCVRDDVTGILVPPKDVEALAAAICRLLDDKQTRVRMGVAAREMLERELAPSVVAASTVDVYRAAIRQFHGDPDPNHARSAQLSRETVGASP